MWTYDVPTGTWRNDELSARVVQRAMAAGNANIAEVDLKVRCGDYVLAEDGTKIKCREFGSAVEADVDDEELPGLVRVLASVLPQMRSWTLAPHLRRADDSKWMCSCGAEFAHPSDFGRIDHGRQAHLDVNPEHTLTFTPRPGRSVAWYGIGFLKQEPKE